MSSTSFDSLIFCPHENTEQATLLFPNDWAILVTHESLEALVPEGERAFTVELHKKKPKQNPYTAWRGLDTKGVSSVIAIIRNLASPADFEAKGNSAFDLHDKLKTLIASNLDQ